MFNQSSRLLNKTQENSSRINDSRKKDDKSQENQYMINLTETIKKGKREGKIGNY